MSTKPIEASQIDRARLAAVCREHGLDLLLLYGSHATGHARPGSDVDVGLVRPGGRLTLNETAALQTSLEPFLPAGDLDLVDLRRVPGLLRHLACERGRLLYERTPAVFAAFRVLAWNLYQDERIELRRHDSEGIKQALARLAS